MNLLGKIFVALILVMSLIFLGLALSVYSTHQNWRASVDQKTKSLADLRAELEQEKSKYLQTNSNLQLKIDSAEQQVRKLESERASLLSLNEDIQTEINQLKAERRDATAAVSATQQVNTELAKENLGLQSDVIAQQQAKDKAFDEVVKATSELHTASIQLNAQLERNQQLTEQVANMTTVMRRNDIDPNTDSDDVKPRVEGFVSAIGRRAGEERIELTIGSDDGIKTGHTVEVFRGPKYVARATVLSTAPNRSVARIIPDMKVGHIEEGDSVATRINVN